MLNAAADSAPAGDLLKEIGWLLAGAAEVPADDAWLTPAERVRLAAFSVPSRRTDWRLGRWTAKRAVAAFLGGPRDPIEIRPAADGAPEAFLAGEPAPVVLSLSHRAGQGLCAVAAAGMALGCDLELIEPRSGEFVEDFFTAGEQALLERAPAADHPLLANLIWSAKESALKALRQGLRLDTRSVEVVEVQLPAGAGAWSPLSVRSHHTGETFHGWWRRDGGCVLTVAASPPPSLPRAL